VPFKKHSMEEIAGKLAGDLAGCKRRLESLSLGSFVLFNGDL